MTGGFECPLDDLKIICPKTTTPPSCTPSRVLHYLIKYQTPNFTCKDYPTSLYSVPMDLVPQDTREPAEENTYLSDRAVFARNLDQVRSMGKPKDSRRQRGLSALHDSFELIGGVPRLAIYADENPHEFYQLYFKYTQSTTKNVNTTVRVIAPSIPPTALDGDITDIEFEEVREDPADGSSGSPQN